MSTNSTVAECTFVTLVVYLSTTSVVQVQQSVCCVSEQLLN